MDTRLRVTEQPAHGQPAVGDVQLELKSRLRRSQAWPEPPSPDSMSQGTCISPWTWGGGRPSVLSRSTPLSQHRAGVQTQQV